MRHPGVLRYSRLRRSAGYRAGGTWAVHGECLSRRGGEGGVIYVKRTRIAVRRIQGHAAELLKANNAALNSMHGQLLYNRTTYMRGGGSN